METSKSAALVAEESSLREARARRAFYTAIKRRRLTLHTVAWAAGVSSATVTRFVNKETAGITLKVLLRCAVAMDTTVAELLGETNGTGVGLDSVVLLFVISQIERELQRSNMELSPEDKAALIVKRYSDLGSEITSAKTGPSIRPARRGRPRERPLGSEQKQIGGRSYVENRPQVKKATRPKHERE